MTIQPLELTRATLNKHHKMLIGKDWRLADSKKTFEVFNPATGDVIATVPQGGPHDIDLAVQAARENFASRDWRGQSSDDRAKVLWRFAELIDNHRDEIAKLDVLDNGMPMALATAMISASSTWLRHFASESGKICGINASGALSSSSVEFHAYTAREPVGVAGLILAWNGPAGAFLAKAAPALAAGCSLVIKPADQTPLSALRLGELALEAGFPPGTLNIVTGLGDAGQALVEHPGVDKISFTGSTAVGKQIVRTAAETLKRVTLELGGKSPCIVFDDADMEIAIPTAAMSIFANTGQICFAGSRLYVQKKSFERVVAGVAQIAESLCVGDGFDSKTQIGPVISDKQRKRVEDYIALGREEGADIVGVGSSLPDKGFFVRPTVFTNAKPSMRIVREEIFGPVLVVTPFDNVEDVVPMANATRYGLGAGIFTTDVNKIHRIAARIEAGNIWANCYGVNHASMPFGGYKESGWGRELGSEGLDGFLETKSVFVQLH